MTTTQDATAPNQIQGRKVNVEYVQPPVPSTQYDYQATLEGYEPGNPIGYGSTVLAAVQDLAEQYEALRDGDVDEDTPRKAHWFCDECGHADHNKPLPPDRELFYTNLGVRRERTGEGGYKCPKCKSMTLLPKGF